jgi:serine/threonine protein kinase
MLRQINSGRTPRVVESFTDEGRGVACLVMTPVCWGSLEKRIQDPRPYSEETAMRWVAELLEAYLELEDQGAFHGDLAVRNLLVTGPEENASLLMTDFGLGMPYHPYAHTRGQWTYVCPF